MQHIDLSEDEAGALVALLTRFIDDDRYLSQSASAP
jgi:hypothetical protein